MGRSRRRTNASSPMWQQGLVIGFDLSPALIAFRRTAGDANRHLNTLLVALETLLAAPADRPSMSKIPRCSHRCKYWTSRLQVEIVHGKIPPRGLSRRDGVTEMQT